MSEAVHEGRGEEAPNGEETARLGRGEAEQARAPVTQAVKHPRALTGDLTLNTAHGKHIFVGMIIIVF